MRNQGLLRFAATTSLILLVSLATSCRGTLFGDPYHNVHLENATGIPVLWYDPGSAENAPKTAPNFRLRPGEKRDSQWLIPATDDSRARMRVTPKAFDEAGNLVFCKPYTWDDLERSGWKIKIIKGETSCQ